VPAEVVRDSPRHRLQRAPAVLAGQGASQAQAQGSRRVAIGGEGTAGDRGNTQLAERFDPLSVPFLRALKQIVDAGNRVGTPVTLCGELAGRPISAMALLGIGYRSISMSPASIGPVKAMLTELPLDQLTAMLETSLAHPNATRNVRADLIGFAETHNIPL